MKATYEQLKQLATRVDVFTFAHALAKTDWRELLDKHGVRIDGGYGLREAVCHFCYKEKDNE